MSDLAAFAAPAKRLLAKNRPATGALVFADGMVFKGEGFGASGLAVGELCFNTSVTGYQEILTDPSYAGHIINFTFPHIGNVGVNKEDLESYSPSVRGLITRSTITNPANWRSSSPLLDWIEHNNLIGLTEIDTRALTHRIRSNGSSTVAIIHAPNGKIDYDAARKIAESWPGLEGMDLAREVTCRKPYRWTSNAWRREPLTASFKVVAVDYGAKHNILRELVCAGAEVIVVPADTSLETILRYIPDGVFLSNGPGDPAATEHYSVPVVRALLERRIPLFGICLGHQIMALAIGGRTVKMEQGHRGANHPVKELSSGKVEITSQNHGFVVDPSSLPDYAIPTHVSLFDGSNEGFRLTDRPAFAVQYHPEASPGPHDSRHLFTRFIALMAENRSHA